jgi:hypothetical protein
LRAAPSLLLILVLLAGCAPYRIANRQLMFDVSQSLVVTERAATQGAADTPVRATLTRDRYRIDFEMPVQSDLNLLLRAHTVGGEPLTIEGAHVHSAHPATTDSSGAKLFYFDVEASGGAPLDIIVRDAVGQELGRERLRWRIKNHRATYGIEWI